MILVTINDVAIDINSGNIVMAAFINEDGDKYYRSINEEDCTDCYNYDTEELFSELENEGFMYRFHILRDKNISTIEEATLVQIPSDRDRDFPGMSYDEMKDKISDKPHVDLYLFPQLNRGKSRYSSCTILVANPDKSSNVKLIPIIYHTSGGVSVHPTYSKYFKRSFNKHDRHLILGFVKVYGSSIAYDCNHAALDGLDELSKRDSDSYKRIGARYRDSDAPKRINQGPRTDGEYGRYYKASIEDYDRWVAEVKRGNIV